MKVVKMCLILKLMKQYEYTVILKKIISKIQASCIHLFFIKYLANSQIFHPEYFIFLRSLTQNFHYELWFIDQNSKILEIEGKTNITLVINQWAKCQTCAIQFNQQIKYLYKVMDFYPLLEILVKILEITYKNLSGKYSQKLLDHA